MSVPYNTVRPLFPSAAMDIPETLRGGKRTTIIRVLFCSPLGGLRSGGQSSGDLREAASHNQLEELKARNYRWPTLHQPHFLTADFNLLIGLQQCSQHRDRVMQLKSPGWLRKCWARSQGWKKPQHLHQHSGQPSSLSLTLPWRHRDIALLKSGEKPRDIRDSPEAT